MNFSMNRDKMHDRLVWRDAHEITRGTQFMKHHDENNHFLSYSSPSYKHIIYVNK